MNKKLNLVEILKDCPSGMELDSAVYNEVKLISVDEGEDIPFPIRVCREDGYSEVLTKYGQYIDVDFAKCIIFPKGKTTWEGFQRPFKDGDVIYNQGIKAVAIFNKQTDNVTISHCYLNIWGKLLIHHSHCKNLSDWRLATKEEKQKLFDVIKANGYKWNAETKTLEKLIEPKFKVGDWIEFKYYERKPEKVIRIENNVYWLSSGATVMFQDENAWDLTTKKFDITTLKPFDKVLVRGNVGQKWTIDFFSFMDKDKGYPFCLCGHYISQCIPYENNEHLLGTTYDCEGYFKTWE